MSAANDAQSVIRTPDQRLRVFVSSTLAELAEERRVVARAITAVGLSPVMFELGARPHPPQELYRAYLAQSDIFVGVYWQSYGWIGPNMDISGLEDEFRLSESRPRLLYIKAPAPERQPQLAAMIDEIRERGGEAYRTFRTTRELGRLVRDDLALLLSERFASFSIGERRSEVAADSASRADRSLPVTSTSLIGRDDDVDAVVAMLDARDIRMVTLSGPGGIGKTRLAIAVGEAISERDEPRVLFVPLAAITDAASVISRVAAAAGASLEGTRTAQDALIEKLLAARTLLVLDNLEQVAEVAPELDQLLARCPEVKILTTSRMVLRLRAEHEYVVGPLVVPTAANGPTTADVLMLPAVRLFVDRALAVRRTFALTAQNSEAVLEICRRLDGVPLAIELAAAKIRLLDPPALLVRLETVLDALGSGPVDLPERQRTLRATVGWSVGLLGEEERDLLFTLSVFTDGWTLMAAAAVCGTTEDATLDLLDALAGQSLVSVDAGLAEPRFRMLTTVREFAAELLRDSKRLDVERRHAEYFAHLVQEKPSAERLIEWTDRLHADEENVRVAIRWFFEHDLTRLPHLLRTLWIYWQFHDRISEGRGWVSELLRRVDLSDLDERAAAELLFMAADTAVEVGDDAGGLAALEAIQPRITQVNDPRLRNILWLAVAWTLPIIDDVDGALEAATRAYEGFAEDRDSFVASAALTLGMVKMSLGDYEAARPYVLEADVVGSRFEMPWLKSNARTHLAIIEVHAGDPDAARAQIRRALDGLDDARTATLTACLVLSAFGHLAAAGDAVMAVTAIGAMDGLRARAGMLPWPNSRRAEAELRARVADVVPTAQWDVAYTAGYELRVIEALALVRKALDTAPTN